MPPVLRPRKSLPPAVSPAAEKQKPEAKRNAKQKAGGATPKYKAGKREAESRDRGVDETMAHDQGVSQSPSLAEPLHVSLKQDARVEESGNGATPGEGPPFVFEYNGLRVAGGTFEQRAGVIMAFLDREDGSGDQSEHAISGGGPS